jgi:hypothetical protein
VVFLYSPKIKEELIPYLYRWAKSEKVPMTTLVNRIISKEIQGRKDKEADHADQETISLEYLSNTEQ